MQIQKSGLLKPKYDPRRFKYKKVKHLFGAVGETIPNDFVIYEPLEIKSQGTSDCCTSFGSCGVSEGQEGVELSPEYTFFRTKYLMGDWRTFGASPDETAKAHIRYGALEAKDNPFPLEQYGRDFIANPDSWLKLQNIQELSDKALVHKKGGYFEVDNNFKAMQEALWHSYQETDIKKKSCLFVGAYWQPTWQTSVAEHITGYTEEYPHAFYLIGSKNIGGKPYLIGVNSYGKDFGDKGKIYFSEEVINKYFMFAYTFKDFDSDDYKQQYWNIYQWLWDLMVSLRKYMYGIIRLSSSDKNK